MPEYIDREALIRRIKQIHCAECDSYHGVRCRACRVDDTLDYIDSEPAADVAPVRHGRWIDKPTGRYGQWQAWCSACGQHSGIGGIEKNRHKPYCPHCGARMDGKEETE